MADERLKGYLIRLSNEDLRWIKKHAEDTDRTQAAVIRRALRIYREICEKETA